MRSSVQTTWYNQKNIATNTLVRMHAYIHAYSGMTVLVMNEYHTHNTRTLNAWMQTFEFCWNAKLRWHFVQYELCFCKRMFQRSSNKIRFPKWITQTFISIVFFLWVQIEDRFHDTQTALTHTIKEYVAQIHTNQADANPKISKWSAYIRSFFDIWRSRLTW